MPTVQPRLRPLSDGSYSDLMMHPKIATAIAELDDARTTFQDLADSGTATAEQAERLKDVVAHINAAIIAAPVVIGASGVGA